VKRPLLQFPNYSEQEWQMADNNGNSRESWGSKMGIILAVAGSAVGLGNFLRFPVQAAENGGGAFLIPYFISLLLLGIPLMWIEWTVGRYGGAFGHGTAPGVFQSMWNNRLIKYFGVIGVFGPTVILMFYISIESWTLAYSYYSLTGAYADALTQEQMVSFLSSYQGGVGEGGVWPALGFFVVTFVVNFVVMYYGIARGIERFAKIAMPLLFIMGLVLAIRVLTFGTPDPLKPDWNLVNGLAFLWNPDFSLLLSSKVWLAAAGQVFFTLSVGIGMIITYASYLKRDDDVVLSGLTAVSMNTFAEVILGSSIVIPAAFIFFGPVEIVSIAEGGAFNLGFVTMPMIFNEIFGGAFFGFLWFSLLFVAGITSSISLASPAVCFLEDEFGITKREAVTYFGIVCFLLCLPSVLFLKNGVVDELDFWGGTFCLVLFATVETILFGWIFGIDRAWEEAHRGANLRIPKFYKWIIKYVTPLFLFLILGFWLVEQGWNTLMMKDVPPENVPYIIWTRLLLLGLFLGLGILVRAAWQKKKKQDRLEAEGLQS
jgi:neurotransmitter:Na+ symporter, NSS family